MIWSKKKIPFSLLDLLTKFVNKNHFGFLNHLAFSPLQSQVRFFKSPKNFLKEFNE